MVMKFEFVPSAFDVVNVLFITMRLTGMEQTVQQAVHLNRAVVLFFAYSFSFNYTGTTRDFADV